MNLTRPPTTGFHTRRHLQLRRENTEQQRDIERWRGQLADAPDKIERLRARLEQQLQVLDARSQALADHLAAIDHHEAALRDSQDLLTAQTPVGELALQRQTHRRLRGLQVELLEVLLEVDEILEGGSSRL